MAGTRPRRGRRPGQTETREDILLAARAAFAELGFDGATIREIASRAGVDAALVHHYYGTKDRLFFASVRFPVDPDVLIPRIADGPPDELGGRLADTFLSVWEDSESGPALEALLRGAVTNREMGELVKQFLGVFVLRRVGGALEGVVHPDEFPRRASLVASQLFGLAVTRHLLEIEPLASMPREEVVAAVAPTLQRYLTG